MRIRLVIAALVAGQQLAVAQRTTAAITPAEARARLFIIADDSMRGRLAGDIGNYRATEYVAREVRRLGLLPGGENGTFFQNVPLESMRIDPDAALFADGVQLRIGRDFTVAIRTAAGLQFALDSARVIYGGTLGDTTTMISAAQARGRVVILGPHIVNGVREPVRRPGVGLGTRFSEASGVFFAQLDSIAMNPADFGANLNLATTDSRRVTVGGSMTQTAAQRLFGRPLTSLRAGDTGVVVHSTVRLLKETPPYAARNVIAVLRGSDPRLAAEYVAVGAHTDHIGVAMHVLDHDSVFAHNRVFRPGGFGSPDTLPATPERVAAFHKTLDSLRRIRPARRDSINNGADDDGSGTVALLEIAEAFARAPVRPKRSVAFMWFTGEEADLLGSQYFSLHPTIPLDSLVTELQMDQVSRGNAWDIAGGSPGFLYVISSRARSLALGTTVDEANARQKQPFAIDRSRDAPDDPDMLYCRSDHWYFARRGIPVALFSTGWHPDYHQVTDEPQYSDTVKLARVAQLVHDVALDVANRASPLPLDRPGPNLSVRCR